MTADLNNLDNNINKFICGTSEPTASEGEEGDVYI